MTDADPLLNSRLDADFRAAHQALRALAAPGTVTGADDALLPDIVDELEDLVRFARDTAAADLGPTHSWVGEPSPDGQWAPVILQLDLDAYAQDDPRGGSHNVVWEDSAMALAARAYRRECHWDHSPGDAGIWLLSVAPFSSMGLAGKTTWRGTLAGFAILYDRDGDGRYETLAHMWTASGWRRRGIGSSLVQTAKARFALQQADGPITDVGRLLLRACAPELMTKTI